MSTITKNINLIISALHQDNIAAIPTETVYGLAGNAENENAIKKIYHLKKRPITHPLIMHVAKDADLLQWVQTIPQDAQTLIDAYWPGPLTLVFNCRSDRVSPLVTGGQSTVAIRCPKHPVTQQLLARLPFPLVAPSANPFGKISPTTANHVKSSFPDTSLLILDGGRCPIGIESTIISVADEKGYQILRHGVIDADTLQRVLPNRALKEEMHSIRAPGRLDTHYQPQKPLFCFQDRHMMKRFCEQEHQDAYVLSFKKEEQFKQYQGYTLPQNPQKAAYELYFQLRQADQSDATMIVMELPPNTPAWEGIRERVLKAGRLMQI